MGNQVRNNRRARTSLRKGIFVTGNLRDQCCRGPVQAKILILFEESANSSEIDRREEVLQIHIEDVPSMTVSPGIGDNRAAPHEPMGSPIDAALILMNLVEAVLQQIGQSSLHELQS